MASAAEPRVTMTVTEYYDSDVQSIDGLFLRARGALCPDGKRRTVHAAKTVPQDAQSRHLIGFVYVAKRRVAGIVSVEMIAPEQRAFEKTVRFEPVGANAALVGG